MFLKNLFYFCFVGESLERRIFKKICPSFFPYFTKKHNINFKKKPQKMNFKGILKTLVAVLLGLIVYDMFVKKLVIKSFETENL